MDEPSIVTVTTLATERFPFSSPESLLQAMGKDDDEATGWGLNAGKVRRRRCGVLLLPPREPALVFLGKLHAYRIPLCKLVSLMKHGFCSEESPS